MRTIVFAAPIRSILRPQRNVDVVLPDGTDAPGSVDPALSAPHVGDTGGSVHHR